MRCKSATCTNVAFMLVGNLQATTCSDEGGFRFLERICRSGLSQESPHPLKL